jgi:hypothetical protein
MAKVLFSAKTNIDSRSAKGEKMRTKQGSFHIVAMITLITILAITPASVEADHAFGFHWRHEENPFTLRFGDNVSSGWDSHLRETVDEWSESSVLNTRVVEGSTTGRRCRPSERRVQVCSAAYGQNDILYQSTIFIVRDHIRAGIIQLNDTYLNVAPFNTRPWRRYILCQQIGFTLGLDLQDFDPLNTNIGSCNDLTFNPGGTPRNTKPNRHDFDMLEQIYAHLDGDNDDLALASGLSPDFNAFASIDATAAENWGVKTLESADGRSALYANDLGNGLMTLTLIGWAK